MTLPIADLINERMAALSLDRERLGYRLGYTNPIKAAGRVQALADGFIDNRKGLRALHRLPDALEVPPATVGKAVAETRAVFAERERHRLNELRRIEQEREAVYRASFKPHGYIYTRETWPSSVTMFALADGERRWLILPLDLSKRPVNFGMQAMDVLPNVAKNGEDGNFYVPFLGRVIGYFVNFTPDRAVRYDLEGNPVEALDRAYRLRRSSVRLGN